MDIFTALKNMEALANGIDPTSGEVLPDTSPYNSPEVIRSLFTVIGALKQPKKSKKSVEQKQQENISKGLPKNAGLPWTEEERERLIHSFNANISIGELSNIHGRTSGAITSELKKQGLIEEIEATRM
ncbi:hypothetical protein CWB89_00215 [Pseudoalteromonas piscicida]|uniref:Uncharacterized protein n=1 Tax=Pseudoalteromonas piscicida TaxID=43662 RepID=A0AAQ2EVH3_PSEO7|nr:MULTISPECIES: hypothetical protein [Pseudoalteromonas]TMN40705.1 hypothetical protein CWB94_09265 [Pseudoalteromonas piscicida]TMN43748.1 hypothetical protein CWB95_04790 [Pseudoalteromonas piscicida]TMN50800.1 hypothetical protein CWB91_13920 [Pseudoalteromonas piscicida]TMN57086.1 hypothetical protein CWB92_00745 [Pseudoalteromonas piscicida]TMN59377.1 hypothetical protein CWB93_01950 [Pseudoalteromonas piscicida]